MDFGKPYLTYDEYQLFGGELEQMPFNLQEFKARQEINKYTFGRLVNLENQIQEVKICMYEVIKVLSNNATSNISSESVGKYSVTYKDSQEVNSSVSKIIKSMLSNCCLEDGTPYLYRG